MIRIAALIVIVVATLGLAFWAASLPHDVTISFSGGEMELSRVTLAIFIAVLGAAMALVWGVIAWMFNLPGQLTRNVRQSKVNKARTALADGLIAAEGGDAEQASKQARRAESSAIFAQA